MTETRDLPLLRATAAATSAVRELVREKGPVMFVLSATTESRACDGSAADVRFLDGEFRAGSRDVLVGRVEGAPFYVDQRQLDAWPHGEIVLDTEPGYADGLSLAAGEDQHFVAHVRR
jgi:uncharacterized protein (DUF779 family)